MKGLNSGMHRFTRLALTVTPLTVLGALVPLAHASSGPQFSAPLAYGTVDFGDRVQYRVDGSNCAGVPVQVHVGGKGRADALGSLSHAAADPLAPGSCIGIAAVPSEAQVRGTGWAPGD